MIYMSDLTDMQRRVMHAADAHEIEGKTNVINGLGRGVVSSAKSLEKMGLITLRQDSVRVIARSETLWRVTLTTAGRQVMHPPEPVRDPIYDDNHPIYEGVMEAFRALRNDSRLERLPEGAKEARKAVVEQILGEIAPHYGVTGPQLGRKMAQMLGPVAA
jgi:hypothetical protein